MEKRRRSARTKKAQVHKDMENISTIVYKRKDLMDTYMSLPRLYETRNDPDGAIQKMRDWLYSEEGGVHFDLKHMKLGKDDDDFVMLYYFESKRYKIFKDGRVMVSGADADDMFKDIERDLQALVDTILNDELRKTLAKASARAGAKSSRAKVMDDNPETRTTTLVGIVEMPQQQ